MNKKEFKELDREQMIIAFNQLKDDYSVLFDKLDKEKEKNKELEALNKFDKGLYGLYVREQEKNKKLEKENTDLKELYIRTAKHQEKIGHEELAGYMLAQIQAVPTFTTWEDYITWVSKDKIRAKIEECKKQFNYFMEKGQNDNMNIYHIKRKAFEELLEEV